jgi:hypothetical protein
MNELHPKSARHRTMSRFSSSKGHDPDDELCFTALGTSSIRDFQSSSTNASWIGLGCAAKSFS